MTTPRAPLQVLLRRFIVWEATAVLRHDLRNHLAAVRNATFYVRRRVEALAPGGGTIAIACDRDGDHVMISVGDDGPGIAPDALAHAFDPGFTTRPGHLGLGLNIVRRVAGRARGTVELAAKARGVCAMLRLRAPSEVP